MAVGADLVFGFGQAAVSDPRSGGGGELEVAGDEVGVEVGVDHPGDGQVIRGRVGEVFGDVAARVDDDCLAGRFITNQVGAVGQASEVVLL